MMDAGDSRQGNNALLRLGAFQGIAAMGIPVSVPIQLGTADPFGGNLSGTAVLAFDGDGDEDLIITPSYLSARPELPVILLRQTPQGFVDARNAFVGGTPTTAVPRTVQVADFNGDGKDDYFAADTGLEIIENGAFIHSENRIFLSTGDGRMTAQTLPTKAFNHGSCQGDVDEDGRIDVVVTPLSAPKTYALLNSPTDWQFNQARLPVELTQFDVHGDFNPSSCAFADINGDGHADLVASEPVN